MKYDLNSLNNEQLNALKQINGGVLVTAGAGSGKTRLLTHRVAYLIKELGVSPYHILAITFTNKAAGEMRERISDMVEGADKVWISTFHSMCARILRMEIDVLYPFNKNFTIYSETDSDKVVKEVLAERGVVDDKIKKRVAFHISNWKNGSQKLEEYVSTNEDEFDMKKIGSYMLAYQNKLASNNALDFDDLLVKTCELFKKNPDILNRYATRFEYILVDEFQDTNTVQYNLVKMLSSVHGNVFVVGDEDQCIYTWRGANFKNIFNFKNDFPDTKVFKLEQNYRSTPEIIEVANNVIKENTTRLNKNMYAVKPSGDKPELYNAYDEKEEASWVVKNIQKLLQNGYDYKDFAVLMRVNALSRSFEEAFLSANIPHRIFGGFKFYERVEIKNLISYLRLFVNPKDDVSFERIINFPKRGIGESTVAKLKEFGNGSLLENALGEEFKLSSLYKKFDSFVSPYKEISLKSKAVLSQFVEEVINGFKIREAFNPSDEEDLNRLLNIDQFISSVKDFEELNLEGTLDDFLENITLSSDTDSIGEGGAVTIATVHAVKGLEFKVVFLVGVEEGIFPLQRAMNDSGELEEERRLMYVALTRAEEKLYISYASKRYLYGRSQYQSPSRFCREFKLLALENPRNSSYEKDRYYDRNFDDDDYGVSYRGGYAQKRYGEQGGGYSKGGYGSGYSGYSAYRKGDDFDYGSSHKKELSSVANKFNHSQEEKTSVLFNKNLVMKKEEHAEEKDVSKFKIGQKLFHPRFGIGILQTISDDGLVGDINFEDFGVKSLMLNSPKIEIMEE